MYREGGCAVILIGQGLDGDCEMVTDLLNDHFSLAVYTPLGEVNVNHIRKMLRSLKYKTDCFIDSIKTWYKKHVRYVINQFYDNMVKVTEELLNNKKHKCKEGKALQFNKYYNDEMLRVYSRMIKQAHKKWEQSGKDDSDRTALMEVAKLCGKKIEGKSGRSTG